MASNPARKYSGLPGNTPATDAVAIVINTPLDDTARAIYVGVGGDVSLVTAGGSTVIFKSVPSGTILPVSTTNVTTANTSATNLVALY